MGGIPVCPDFQLKYWLCDEDDVNYCIVSRGDHFCTNTGLDWTGPVNIDTADATAALSET